jgi:hypothetical protein
MRRQGDWVRAMSQAAARGNRTQSNNETFSRLFLTLGLKETPSDRYLQSRAATNTAFATLQGIPPDFRYVLWIEKPVTYEQQVRALRTVITRSC